ncbi:MAG: DUF58 domain-containing protein, partial [Pirellulales bacterium]
LRHVNWKLFARQKRLYVKQYNAETNLNLYILLDVSGSMDCASTGHSKLQYGAALAAALAHLALKQHDAVGITLFADSVVGHLPPKAKPHQLDEILRTIATTTARPPSDASRALHQAAELCHHRGLVVIISDLFDDLPAIIRGLDHLQFRNHEVILFQVLDPWERHLPLEGNIRFRDLESAEELTTHAEAVRDDYQRVVGEWCASLEKECLNRSIDRTELITDEPLDRAVLDYLVKRARSH